MFDDAELHDMANTATSEDLYEDPEEGDVMETINRIIEREKAKIQAEFHESADEFAELVPEPAGVTFVGASFIENPLAEVRHESARLRAITEMREVTNRGLAELDAVRATLVAGFHEWRDAAALPDGSWYASDEEPEWRVPPSDGEQGKAEQGRGAIRSRG